VEGSSGEVFALACEIVAAAEARTAAEGVAVLGAFAAAPEEVAAVAEGFA
jgi:hypothetical protein